MLVTTDRNNPGRFDGDGGTTLTPLAERVGRGCLRGEFEREQQGQVARSGMGMLVTTDRNNPGRFDGDGGGAIEAIAEKTALVSNEETYKG
jgi:hypothetical protein